MSEIDKEGPHGMRGNSRSRRDDESGSTPHDAQGPQDDLGASPLGHGVLCERGGGRGIPGDSGGQDSIETGQILHRRNDLIEVGENVEEDQQIPSGIGPRQDVPTDVFVRRPAGALEGRISPRYEKRRDGRNPGKKRSNESASFLLASSHSHPFVVQLHFSVGEDCFDRGFFPRKFSRSDPSVVYRVVLQEFVFDIAEIDGGIGTKPFLVVDPSFVFVLVVMLAVVVVSLGCVEAALTVRARMSFYVAGAVRKRNGGRKTRSPECRAGRQHRGEDDCGPHDDVELDDSFGRRRQSMGRAWANVKTVVRDHHVV